MKDIEIEMLIKETNKSFKVNLKDANKNQLNVFLRAILIKKIYSSTHITLRALGSYFNRNHATVIHALKLYENNIKYKDFQELQIKINSIRKKDIKFCNTCYY